MKDSMCDYDVYAFYVLQTLIDPRWSRVARRNSRSFVWMWHYI